MNNSSGTTENTYSRSTDLALLPAYFVVVILGIAGNSLVIMVVRKRRSMHTTTNYLLANVAAADLNTLFWCIPGIVMRFVRNPGGVPGDYLCRFVSMHHIAGISLFASGLSLTLLSVERYNAFLNPMNARLRLTKGTVKYPIAVSWLLSVLFVTPLLIYQTYSDQLKACTIDWQSDLSPVAYWSALALIITTCFGVVCFCYFNIIKELYFSNSAERDNACSISQDVLAKRKILKLSVTVTLVFLVSFLPFTIASASMISTSTVFYKVSYFLVFCSAALNPICYAFQSSNYRTAFKETLRRSRNREATTGDLERSLQVCRHRRPETV